MSLFRVSCHRRVTIPDFMSPTFGRVVVGPAAWTYRQVVVCASHRTNLLCDGISGRWGTSLAGGLREERDREEDEGEQGEARLPEEPRGCPERDGGLNDLVRGESAGGDGNQGEGGNRGRDSDRRRPADQVGPGARKPSAQTGEVASCRFGVGDGRTELA